MSVRISQQLMMNQALDHARARNQAIARLQNQLATGLRVAKPSDDPAVLSALLPHKAAAARMDVDLQNISAARLKLNASVSNLTAAVGVLSSAQQIAASAGQSQNRETLAQDVDALIDELLSIANATAAGGQLYSGAASHERAFAVTARDENGRPTRIEYQGSGQRSQVLAAPDTPIDTLYAGSEVFQSATPEASTFWGDTGAAAGRGTDSAKGQGELLVRHTLTAYQGGAGVSPGARSASGDTIIGPHTLTIENDAVLGRVARLDGGPTVAFSASDVDLAVTGPHGELVYVDFASLPGGFLGDIPILAEGTLSVDGGLTETAIDFSQNQTLVDSVRGAVTNVDSSNIRRSGVDRIDYVGSADAFQALMQLRDLLRNSAEMSTPELTAAVDSRLADIERIQDHVLSIVGEQSVTLDNLEALEARTRDIQLETQLAVGEMENADMAEVVLQLQNEQNMLQFVYASAAGIFDVSLLDFLR